MIGWHLVFALLAVVTAVLILGGTGGTPAREHVASLALLAVLCLYYVVVGIPALRSDEPGPWALRYVAGAVVLTVALFAVLPVGAVMLIVLYPHIWALLPFRRATVATATTALGIAIADVARSGLSVSTLRGALIPVLLIVVIAPLLGIWISKIIQQSRERAQLVADLTATRAELAAVSHDAGVLAERESLAAEIHDTLAQGFTSVLMLLQAVDAELTDHDPAMAREHLAQAERTARDNLAEARSLVAVLTPTLADAGSLPEALRRLAERFGRESGVAAELTVTGEQRALPSAGEVVLLRVLQEALTNVRKHAGAHQVSAHLRYEEEQAVLEVTDDGRGFDPDALPGDGFGLAGMRSRARQIGATVGVRSTVGEGTTVSVSVPHQPTGEPAAAQPALHTG